MVSREQSFGVEASLRSTWMRTVQAARRMHCWSQISWGEAWGIGVSWEGGGRMVVHGGTGGNKGTRA